MEKKNHQRFDLEEQIMNLFGWRKNGQKETKTSTAVRPTMKRDLRKKEANLLLTTPEIYSMQV